MAERSGSSHGNARAARAAGAGSYPGEQFGLPEHGPGAVAGFGVRFGALFIDWAFCSVIALSTLHSRLGTIVVFALEAYLLTALTGFTVGQRLLRLRVQRLDGRPVGFGWAAVRTLLLLAVIPALLSDRDLRGLHDRAANTVVVRL